MSDNDEYYSKLSFHLFNSIQVFLSLHQFKLSLSQKLKNNKEFEQDIFLIDKNWFSEYKDFYLFNKLFDILIQFNLSTK